MLTGAFNNCFILDKSPKLSEGQIHFFSFGLLTAIKKLTWIIPFFDPRTLIHLVTEERSLATKSHRSLCMLIG